MKTKPKPRRSTKPAPILKSARLAHIARGLQPLALPIDCIKPDPENVRIHPQWNLDQIKASLQRFGQQKPIVASRDNVIIAGNGTWLAAKALGWKEIAVSKADLTPGEVEAYAIADNRTGESSIWDESKLAAALARMTPDLVAATGFSAKDLEEKLGAPAVRGVDDPPPEGKAVSARGDLWILGEHRLLVGDATKGESYKRLIRGDRADLVFTDPPYGIEYTGSASKRWKPIAGDDRKDDDLLKLLTPAMKHMAQACVDTAAFYIWHASRTRREFEHAMTAAGLVEVGCIIWVKPAASLGRGDYQWQHEPCLYASKAGHAPDFYGDRTQTTVWRVGFTGHRELAANAGNGLLVLDGNGHSLFVSSRAPKGRKIRRLRLDKTQRLQISSADTQSDVWEVSRDTKTELIHPTQKPVDLAKRAIENSSKIGDLVLDPFLGSGSTLIACELLERRCVGMEIDPARADGIVRRWEKVTGKAAVREDAKGKRRPGTKGGG